VVLVRAPCDVEADAVNGIYARFLQRGVGDAVDHRGKEADHLCLIQALRLFLTGKKL
jgi:hypothetical protein